jgi:hypothetical protein
MANFKGGPAGDGPKGGKKYNAPVPDSGVSQPILLTQTSGDEGTNFPKCKSTSPASSRGTPDFMPTGGTIPSSPDVADPGCGNPGQGIDWNVPTNKEG